MSRYIVETQHGYMRRGFEELPEACTYAVACFQRHVGKVQVVCEVAGLAVVVLERETRLRAVVRG